MIADEFNCYVEGPKLQSHLCGGRASKKVIKVKLGHENKNLINRIRVLIRRKEEDYLPLLHVCRGLGRRWPSGSQEGNRQQKPSFLAPWLLALENVRK